MPYTKKADRDRFSATLDPLLQEIVEGPSMTAGDLNYLITKLCHGYLTRKGENYATHNEVMGVLTCASSEYYARRVRPYEDKKIKENGDV